jgi:xanthine dehydrogenase YagS FAD-binding subunit
MQAFEWANAKSFEDASRLLAPAAGAADPDETFRPIGGGQDLHTTMKSYIERPRRVVNLKTIPNASQISFEPSKGGFTFGATATLTDIEEHPDVQKQLPGLAEAIRSVATPQIRNVGTIGGNLAQRPRCWYFRHENLKCLKRGGETCFAKDGENKFHAIFATEGPCVITHPSDLAPMLAAMDATISVTGSKGSRDVAAKDFFILPEKDVRRETVLSGDDVITAIRVLRSAVRSTYLKFKERESLDFAMASVAAVVDVQTDHAIAAARVVLGGVAPIPWLLPEVGAFLIGKKLDSDTIAKAGQLAIANAKPLSQNGYKLPLVQTLVRRALTKLA